MLTTEHPWWLLRSASPLEAHCWCACQRFTLSFHYTAAPPHIKHFRSGQLVASPLNKCFVKTQIHLFSLLYTFVVLQVQCVWRLLSTACTVKPHKRLVSLWFHCQWNHRNCTASIPMHCPFKDYGWLLIAIKALHPYQSPLQSPDFVWKLISSLYRGTNQ